MFGGPWSYDTPPRGEPSAEDKAWLDSVIAGTGAVIGGRNVYEAAGHWGGANPWGLPFFIVTHRTQEQPPGDAFTFAGSLEEALEQASAAAGQKTVNIMGGADIIRQALAARVVDELTLIVAPVILGAGKRLFDGFTASFDVEQLAVRQLPLATFLEYRVKR